MTLNHLVALLTAISLNANPAENAIPMRLKPPPMADRRELPKPPVKKRVKSLGIETTAKSVIVVDVGSGAVLYAKNANVDRSIASLTKLMTAMVVLDQGLRGEERITIEAGDFEHEGRPTLEAGDTMTRKEAFRALLVGSVNEIANAFARTSPGGRAAFVDAMREKAATLGLAKASYLDPTGINLKNRASATDVAIKIRSALAYPEIRDLGGAGPYDLKVANPASVGGARTIKIKPTNNLVTSYLNAKPYQIIAAKTGSLPEAGFSLAQVTKNPGGRQVIAVVLGSENHFARFQEVKGLTQWAFDTYEWQ